MKRHSVWPATAAFLAALVLAPAASADTRHVAPSPTGLNANPCTDALPCDLTKASALAGANDTILVESGNYPNELGIGIIAPGVDVVGESGSTKPKLTFIATSPLGLGITFGPAGGEVRNLDIEAPNGAIAVSSGGPITLDDVDVNSSAACLAAGPGSTIVDSDLTQGAGVTPGGCMSAGDGSTIRNVTVSTAGGAFIGIPAVLLGHGLSVDRLTTTGPGGVNVGFPFGPSTPTTTTIRRSNLQTSGSAGLPGSPPLFLSGPAVVTDTLLRANNPAASIGGPALLAASSAKLRNVTAISSGLGSVGLLAMPAAVRPVISVKNSILRADVLASDVTVNPGLSSPFPPGSPICTTTPEICLPTLTPDLTIDHSNFRGATGTVNAASGQNQTGDPQFTDAAGGDFRPLSGSPVIDAGVDDADNGALDLAGNARKQGTAVDLGAFEFPVAPPPVDNTPQQQQQDQQPTTPSGGGEPVITPPPPARNNPPLSRLRLTNRTFAISSRSTAVSTARAKKGTTFVYTLSEPARTTITIERAVTGRRQGRRCVRATRRNRKARKCTRYVKVGALGRSGANGANAVPFSGRIGRKAIKPGKYRASMRAVDAAGNRSSTKRIGFRVVKR